MPDRGRDGREDSLGGVRARMPVVAPPAADAGVDEDEDTSVERQIHVSVRPPTCTTHNWVNSALHPSGVA